jgi:hypothetical protein
MTNATILLLAHVDNTGGAGPLTLAFPLILVFIVLPVWIVWLRRSRSR